MKWHINHNLLPMVIAGCVAMLAMNLTSCKSSKNVVVDDVYDQPPTSSHKHDNEKRQHEYGDENRNEALYREIDEWMGVKYKYGGNTKDGVDCSGLVVQLYLAVYDKKLQRNSARIFEDNCREINKEELCEGDLVFFSSSRKKNRINHVGLYLYDGKFVHAGSKGVVIDSFDSPYYSRHFVAAGRVK